MQASRKVQKLRRVTVPVSSGLTLGIAALVGLPADDSGAPLFIVGFLVGGLLGMLVGWPMLWLVERFLKTPLRYIAGGMATGLLIWVGCVLPNLIEFFTAPPEKPFVQPRYFKEGAVFFVCIGLVSGAMSVVIHRLMEWVRVIKLRDGNL